MYQQTHGKQVAKRRSCLGCLGLFLVWVFPLLALLFGGFLASFFLAPPFGDDRAARVLLVGLDDLPREGGARRSDTIILYAGRLDGGGATLISVPRDAWVEIPGYRSGKINGAYAHGQAPLLREVLAQPELLGDELPYYMVFDSETVRAVVDSLGGIEVDVPRAMHYDDNWGNLHIDLQPGRQILNGEQAVGYLRWRKNNNHRAGESDFARSERQREVLQAIGQRMQTWQGLRRFPHVYQVFRRHTETNLTTRQMMVMAWASRQIHSDAVPGIPRTVRGISYVFCDWAAGRDKWFRATQGE